VQRVQDGLELGRAARGERSAGQVLGELLGQAGLQAEVRECPEKTGAVLHGWVGGVTDARAMGSG